MIQRVLAFIGPISLLWKIGAVAAILATIWGAWQFNNYKQRQVGAKQLENRLQKDDAKTIKEKEKRDDKLQDCDDCIDDILTR